MAALFYAIIAIAAAIEIWNHLLSPGQKVYAGNILSNFYSGAISVATPVLAEVQAELKPIVDAFVSAFSTYGPAMRDAVETPVAAVARDAFNVAAGNLVLKGVSTPDNAVQVAADAFAAAFGFGISSAAVTAAFEAAFPEKLNVLNGAGPMLAQLAGFAEISAAIRDPLYRAAFGQSAEYHFRSIFKPGLPDEGDAVTWHARRLLSDDQLRTIFGFSGLKPEYEAPYIAGAYRGVQPRVLATLYQDVEFDTAKVIDMLQFSGIRDSDLTTLVAGFKLASVRNVRNQYVSAVLNAAERGTLTDAEVLSDLNDLGFSSDAINWVNLTIATRKLEQLAELYRKSISEAYSFGTIADADYVPALEAIGIAAADANAHYAVDSIKKHGKEAAALAREAAAVAKFIDKQAIAAAKAEFIAGSIDDVALAAAFLGAAMPALAIPFAVTIETQRKAARRRVVFGKIVGPGEAVTLREQVAALKEQRIKGAIDNAAALARLDDWGIPDPNAGDLVAEWAAQADKTKLPIP